jgi:hypothetical protein
VGARRDFRGKTVVITGVADAVFRAASRSKKRLVVLSGVGRLTRIVHKLCPGLYERLMTRSLSSELER